MDEREAALHDYRNQLWCLGLIPGMTVRVGGHGDFPDLTVTYQLGAKHSFRVERLSADKIKVTNLQLSVRNTRIVKLVNVQATIVTWATSRDVEAAANDARYAAAVAKEKAETEAVKTLYAPQIELVNRITGGRATRRYESYPLDPENKGKAGGGRFEFSIEDDGEVRFELNLQLPTTVEGKLQIDPTVKLLDTLAFAVAEAYTTYCTRAKRVENEAKHGKVVSING